MSVLVDFGNIVKYPPVIRYQMIPQTADSTDVSLVPAKAPTMGLDGASTGGTALSDILSTVANYASTVDSTTGGQSVTPAVDVPTVTSSPAPASVGWGKILAGAGLGAAVAGPLGAAIGAGLGAFFNRQQ